MADEKKSEAIFSGLHRALAERGLFGQQRQLEQYRVALAEEHAAELGKVSESLSEAKAELQAAEEKGMQLPAEVPETGAQQAGMPADSPQPTKPVP